MGRPPCCDKVGVKKGPWTPEEDITLVSYVQQHGPGNWRAVPTNTGLRRCSKSCRLRWANYLRPGIKRGTFTDNDEKMIIQLQALLGNKWAAIASYLPERTDNDIKNYWNTHLKKKLKKQETDQTTSSSYSRSSHSLSRGQWERRLQADIHTAKQALRDALSVVETANFSDNTINGGFPYTKHAQTTSLYASSTENIARLLKEWVKGTPKLSEDYSSSSNATAMAVESSFSINGERESTDLKRESENENDAVDLSQAFESLFGFESIESSNSEDIVSGSTSPSIETRPDPNGLAPLSVFENWLLDDQGKEYYLENFSFDEKYPNLF